MKNEVKKQVLFLCTGNSCRSQMAEGWANFLLGDIIQAHSAGTHPQVLNQYAVKVMAEAGVDISHHRSKHVDDFTTLPIALTVTVCDNAAESCPIPPNNSLVLHQPFDDPPRLAQGAATEAAVLEPYRRVRDEIRNFILLLPTILEKSS